MLALVCQHIIDRTGEISHIQFDTPVNEDDSGILLACYQCSDLHNSDHLNVVHFGCLEEIGIHIGGDRLNGS